MFIGVKLNYFSEDDGKHPMTKQTREQQIFAVLRDLLLTYAAPDMGDAVLDTITWHNVSTAGELNRAGHLTSPLLEVHATWFQDDKHTEECRTFFENVRYDSVQQRHVCDDASTHGNGDGRGHDNGDEYVVYRGPR